MRHQLEQFEGQLVHFDGYIAKRVQQPEDLHDVCLQSVRVRKFDPTEPVMESKPVKVDHLWLQGMEGSSLYTKELMRPATGLARCGYYTRKNGTIDLGLVSVLSICWEELGESIKDARSWDEYCACVESFKKSFDKPEVVVFSLHEPPLEAELWFKRACKRITDCRNAEALRLMTRTANGPCKGLDLLPKVKRGRKAAAGFS